jgi:hypothetical protein
VAQVENGIPARAAGDRVVELIGIATEPDGCGHEMQELRRSLQQKDQNLSILVHELCNAIAPIKTALEILTTCGDNPDLVRTLQALISRQVTQLARGGLIAKSEGLDRGSQFVISLPATRRARASAPLLAYLSLADALAHASFGSR